MKLLGFTLILLTLLAAGVTFAQDSNQSEYHKLNRQVVALAEQGKLDEAIQIARKAVKLGSTAKSLTPTSHAVLVDNLARLLLRRI